MEADAREQRIKLLTRFVGTGMVAALAFCALQSQYFRNPELLTNNFLVYADDRFMDFFNVNWFTGTLDPYPPKARADGKLDGQSPYPPFAILTAHCFAKLGNYDVAEPEKVRDSLLGTLNYGALAGPFLLLFFAAVYRAVRGGGIARDLRSTLILGLSYPLIFAFDRGNYVMIAWLGVFGFIHYYERKRVLASTLLAVAISTKIYPAMFLLLLLCDRRWRDCALVLAATVALNLGSLAFFERPILENVRMFVENVFLASRPDGYYSTGQFGRDFAPIVDAAWSISLCNLVRVPYVFFSTPVPHCMSYYYPAFAIVVIAAAVFILRREAEFWKRVLVVTILAICLPGLSFDYNLLYLMIPTLLYLQKRSEVHAADYFYIVCLGLLLVPKYYVVLGWAGAHILTIQALLNPLLLLILFTKVFLEHCDGRLLIKAGIVFARLHIPRFLPVGARP